MGNMRVEVPHNMPLADAKLRMEALGDYLQNRHGIKVVWNGNSASANGRYLVVGIEGTMTVSEKMVDFEGKDPGFLWRGKAKDYLAGKLKSYLDTATPVEQLPRK